MRKKKLRPIEGHFVAIGNELQDAPAYLAMRPHTRLIYIALLREIRYYDDGSNNNGRVYLSTRSAARRVNTRQATAWDSFNELDHYRFIVQTRAGMPGKSGRSARWRLTDIACDNADGTKMAATKDYLNWDGVLYDQKAKRKKAQKPKRTTSGVILHAYQGPDTPRVSGSDTPRVSGDHQNGRLPDTPGVSNLDSFPSSLSSIEPKAGVEPEPEVRSELAAFGVGHNQGPIWLWEFEE